MSVQNTDPVTSAISGFFKNPGKTTEKGLLYIAGILTSTNVFGAGSMDMSFRTLLTLGVAAILTGLHISTPTPKSGSGQL